MKFWLRILLGAIVVVGIAIGGLSYVYWDQTVQIGSTAINYVRYWSASALPQVAPSGAAVDWPSYNKTLTSNRFSELSQIDKTNAEKLKVLCTYDTGAYTGFNSGLLQGE